MQRLSSKYDTGEQSQKHCPTATDQQDIGSIFVFKLPLYVCRRSTAIWLVHALGHGSGLPRIVSAMNGHAIHQPALASNVETATATSRPLSAGTSGNSEGELRIRALAPGESHQEASGLVAATPISPTAESTVSTPTVDGTPRSVRKSGLALRWASVGYFGIALCFCGFSKAIADTTIAALSMACLRCPKKMRAASARNQHTFLNSVSRSAPMQTLSSRVG